MGKKIDVDYIAQHMHTWVDTARAVYREELNREAGSKEIRDMIVGHLRDGWGAQQFRDHVRNSQEYKDQQNGPHPDPGPSPQRRTGRVRADNRAVADDGGPFLALGATLFWALWGYRHDRARLERNLRYLNARGVDYIRALGVVGPSGWSDRTITPGEAVQDAGQFTDLAYDSFGIRTQWTIFGGIDLVSSPDQREHLVREFRRISSGREHKIFAFEVANEGWQTGFPGDEGLRELKRLAEILQSTGILTALTAPQDLEVCKTYGGYNGVATIHYDRDPGQGGWRPVRQPWGYPGEYQEKEHYDGPMPRVVFNNEPIGPQASVASEEDLLRLLMAYVTTFFSQNAAYCFHAGPGIRGGGAEDRARGRAANFDELDSVHEALAAIQRVRAVLPPDLPNWDRQNAQWPGHPFEGLARAVDEGKIVRSNAAVRGDDFWVTVLGISSPDVIARAKRPCVLAFVNTQGQFQGEIRVNQGEAIRFEGTGEAAIIKGRFI